MSKSIFGATIVLAMTFAGYSHLSVAADKDAISMVQTTVYHLEWSHCTGFA